METKKRDKRKVLPLLPLLVTPLLALGFYAMGGGKVGSSGKAASGINATLPDASFKKQEPVDKMGFYALAKDTAGVGLRDGLNDRLAFQGGSGKEKTAEIQARLALLDKEINSAPVSGSGGKSVGSSQAPNKGDGGMKSDVDRLELMMKSMKADKGTDPEMEQMSGLLEKIMDIQNPSRLQTRTENRIYEAEVRSPFQAVPAEIADGMKVVQGSTIRLRLLDSVVLKNVTLAKGHEVFGLCRIVNQRLLLEIKSIRHGELIIPVDLVMYGLDGMPGISARDAVVGEVASAGAVDAVSGISVYGMEGVAGQVAGQVAGAGIDAAKSLFSRKVRVVRVKLRAGDRVLLRVNKP